jgi:hypothetical protein
MITDLREIRNEARELIRGYSAREIELAEKAAEIPCD